MTFNEIEGQIRELIIRALKTLCARHAVAVPAAEHVYVQIPRNFVFGDLASNVAIQLSKSFRRPPRAIAQELVTEINMLLTTAPLGRFLSQVSEEGGFINVRLHPAFFHEVLAGILAEGDRFGTSTAGQGKKVLIEFVSANPTGPLTVAHGRQAAIGDSLAAILAACGYAVTKEYYINDKGRQIMLLGESLRARYRELFGEPLALPEDGYKGEYLTAIARTVADQLGEQYRTAPDDEAVRFFERYAAGHILDLIKEDLSLFGVSFDRWFSQREMEDTGVVARAVELLRAREMVYEKDGAVWLASSRYGDEKDRVLTKSTGELTYLTPDIAYHRDKYERGYAMMINLWGPDHHGYIPRLKAAVTGLGYDPGRLSVLIVQLVTLVKDGEPVSMSTRAGEFVSLRELIADVGRDATRFTYLLRKRDSHLEFDLALAKKHSLDNPVYYVQYAHARICSLFAHSVKEGRTPSADGLALLTEPEEIAIMRALYQFPLVVRQSAEALEPYKLVAYLIETAGTFHSFYAKHRVVTDDRDRTAARLYLMQCIRIVLANGLRLLGVTAPETM